MIETLSKMRNGEAQVSADSSAPVTSAQAGLGFRLHLLVFIVAYLLVVSRRPDALFNAEFFVEDGRIWYSQAYNLGWFHSLSLPYSGYFVTLPRLVAGLALLLPLRFAPLVMNVVGIGLQALPVSILLSARCAMWAKPSERILYAVIYLALPNTWGIDATITNAQWHLALVACLLVLACPTPKTLWRVFDIVIISLTALTGPFCFVLLPIGLVFRKKHGKSPPVSVLAILAAGALLQVITIYKSAPSVRNAALLGASVESFIRILSGQVYLGALLGHNTLAYTGGPMLLGSVALVGTIALVYCFALAGLELKLYLTFCLVLFAAALGSPMVAALPTRWETLIKLSPDSQYWFFPMLGFAWSVIWCFRHAKSQLLQILSATMLFLMCIGIAKDWRYRPYPDLKFAGYAKDLENARAGTVVSIPVNPIGGSVDWTMHLKKR